MRFFIELSYNGRNYHGWQVQPNVNTVQAEINQGLSTILNKKIEVIGAGRTDAGVHAKQMFAHFDSDINFNIFQLMYKLNRFLSHDILIKDIFPVKDNIHSRFNAKSRTYNYYLTNQKNVFNTNTYLFQRSLNMVIMNKACKYLIGKQDFTSFSKSHTQTRNNDCNVMYAGWKEESHYLVFTIQADRFLRNMVRAIVGTLLDVGQGKIDLHEIQNIIQKKERSAAGVSVPAHALFLEEVKYSKSILNEE